MDTVAQASDIDPTIDLDAPSSTSASQHAPPFDTHAATPAEPLANERKAQLPTDTQPRLPLAPGRVLCDRYVLTRIISNGSVCTVFCARDLEAHQGPKFVALKTPRLDYNDPARAIEHLKQEFEATRALSHSGIVEAFELGCDGEIWFMTMELLEGESLAAVMHRRGALLAPHLARRLLRGLSDALAYAHAVGAVHGDLNPANVFILKGDRIKLAGFGARAPADVTHATRPYASPQVQEGQSPQHGDDVFSFACIAYEALTGNHPFAQRSAVIAASEGARPEPPAHLGSERSLALMAALAFEREARPQDIRALAKTLAPDPQRARTHAIEPSVKPPPPDHDKRWWLLVATGIVVMIGAVVFTRLSG